MIEAADGPLRLYSVHLSHLVSETRRAQIKALLDVHHRAAAEGGGWCGKKPDPGSGWTEEAEQPISRRAIILGDFNMTYDAPEYALLVGPSSKRAGRINFCDGFADAWVLAGHDEAEGVTCRGKQAGRSGDARIDYCFVTADMATKVKQTRIDTDSVASDHQPF